MLSFAAIFWTTDAATLVTTIGSLSGQTVSAAFALLTLGALFASLRLKLIAADLGYRLTFRDSIATLSVGQLAGSLFFQLAGQLIARSTMLSRRSMPAAATIILTGYERLAALSVALAFAGCGALYLFGKLTFDLVGGGLSLVRLCIGVLLAAAFGCVYGWSSLAKNIWQNITTKSLLRFSRNVLISAVIQSLTVFSYVIIAASLSPTISIPRLFAASAIVMLAASLPISLSGWGVREASAVAALGFVGLPLAAAVTVGVVIGITSLLAVALLAFLSFEFWRSPPSVAQEKAGPSIDYVGALQLFLPIALATLVVFQVYLPLRSGPLNANLGDPIAVIGGALFLLSAWHERLAPQWRQPIVNVAVIVATALLALSLIIGATRFGWTQWAVTNKFLGWFVLLGYGATGAMIVKAAGARGLQILLKTFAAAVAAISLMDIVLTTIQSVWLNLPIGLISFPISGFSQNRNAFSFECLMAIASGLVAFRGRTRFIVTTILLSAIIIAGSRAAYVATIVLVAAAIALRAISPREICSAVAAAVILSVAVVIIPNAVGHSAQFLFQYVLQVSSTEQHLTTVIDGLRLFIHYPLFGAGLGSYINAQKTLTGVPLVIHSTSVWLLAETGIAGAAAFIVPTAIILWRELNKGTKDIAGLAICLALLAFAPMSLFHELLYQRSLWLILGSALALLEARNDLRQTAYSREQTGHGLVPKVL